jgi:FkbM family methyltransferase
MTAPAMTIFDQRHYVDLIDARGEVIRKIVPQLRNVLGLSTALDAGCGLGFFTEILSECQLKAAGFDGRQTNVDEARRRYPDLTFDVGDIEDSSIVRLGSFDFVLCFGLLYHLENPLRAIRHLRALTGKVLFLESMCLPSDEPFALLREEPPFDDQSLTNLAFYPSEGCIVKMLYGCGFSRVYKVSQLPDHDDFRETKENRRARTVIVAAFEDLNLSGLVKLEEPREKAYPWAKNISNANRRMPLARRVLKKSLNALGIARPVRTSFGARWIPRGDHVGNPVQACTFEVAELLFVERFLRPRMTVLDIGAHHGLYSLLASKKVGPQGRVIAFEPSPRERKALRLNLALNWSRNVSVYKVALGSEAGEADFFVVEGTETGCNSLRPPNLKTGTYRPIQIRVAVLDDWLPEHKIELVDFIKIDAEGAELEVLRGASKLLSTRPRPVLLVEIAEVRTAPWGYSARETIHFLQEMGYVWFSIGPDGSLSDLQSDHDLQDTNLVGVPSEQSEAMRLALPNETSPDSGHD